MISAAVYTERKAREGRHCSRHTRVSGRQGAAVYVRSRGTAGGTRAGDGGQEVAEDDIHDQGMNDIVESNRSRTRSGRSGRWVLICSAQCAGEGDGAGVTYSRKQNQCRKRKVVSHVDSPWEE